MKRIGNNSKEIDNDYISQEVLEKYPNMIYDAKLMLTQLMNKEGCRIIGSTKMNKFRGEIHFSYNPVDDEILKAKIDSKPLKAYISFSHKINSVTYGDSKDQNIMIKTFGNNTMTKFNKFDNTPIKEGDESCFYYCSSVPHKYSIGHKNLSGETYQYSLATNCVSPYYRSYFPEVLIIFAPIPIGIYYHKDDWSMLQMFTSFSAIIGGIYTIMKIVKRACDLLI